MIRLGEWDISWVYTGSKYRASYTYYVQALAGIAIFLMFLDFAVALWWYRRRHNIKTSDNFIVGVGHIYSILLFFGIFVGILSLFRIHPENCLPPCPSFLPVWPF